MELWRPKRRVTLPGPIFERYFEAARHDSLSHKSEARCSGSRSQSVLRFGKMKQDHGSPIRKVLFLRAFPMDVVTLRHCGRRKANDR